MAVPKWAKRLNKSEIKHLKNMDIFTKEKMLKNIELQKTLPNTSKCWECVSIGNKLGVN